MITKLSRFHGDAHGKLTSAFQRSWSSVASSAHTGTNLFGEKPKSDKVGHVSEFPHVLSVCGIVHGLQKRWLVVSVLRDHVILVLFL